MSAGLSPTLLAVSLLWPLGGDLPKDKDTLGSLDAQQVEIPQAELKLDAERLARDYYRQFLASGDGSPERRSEALRRLADLELEAGETAALSSEIERLDAQSYREAITLYQQMLIEHPQYPRNDLVLYQLARAQESGGEVESALQSLDLLIARYPDSALMDEVQFRRGELLFSFKDWRAAEQAYAAVLTANAESSFAENARYKQGWAWFKIGDYERSLDAFDAVVDHRLSGMSSEQADRYLDEAPRAVREMLNDTLRVASLAYSYLDAERSIAERLQRAGSPAYGHVYYLALADLYLSQKRFSDAATVLSAFVEGNPTHARAPYLQIRAIAVFEEGGFASEVLAGRQLYVERFGLEQAYWSVHAKADHPEAVAYLRESLWMLTQQAHYEMQQAQKAPKPDAARIGSLGTQAIDGYRRYLGYFADDSRAPEASFLLAELLQGRGDYTDAIAAFEQAAYAYPAHPRSAEAAYRGLLVRQRQLQTLAPEAPERAAAERAGMDARVRFAQDFPQHEYALLALVDAAEGYYRIGVRDLALTAATAVVQTPGATLQQQRLAWQVIGNARFDASEWAEAEQAFVQMQALDRQLGVNDDSVSERLAASIYRQGELARDAAQPDVAVGHFLRVAQLTPASPIRVKADYDAARTMLDAGRTADAIPLLLAFRAAHPKDPLSDNVTASLAIAYAEAGDRASAAAELERIAAAPTTPVAERQEALLRAADLYQEQGDLLAEKRLRERFIRDYPGLFEDGIEAEQRLLEIAGVQNDAKARSEHARRIVERDARAGALRNDRSRYLAAKASLQLAQPMLDQYKSVALRNPLAKNLKLKRQYMEQALQSYARIADYGVAEALTEATFVTAELYQDFARALYDSERPSELDEVALEEYELMLEEQAYPFEEKAIGIHEANVRRVGEGIYDDWVRRSYARLAELSPGRWNKPEIGDAYATRIR